MIIPLRPLLGLTRIAELQYTTRKNWCLEVTYVCSGSRVRVISEAGTSLQAILLGKPVSGSMADVLVSGIQGDLLWMVVYNTNGEQIFENRSYRRVQWSSMRSHSVKSREFIF